MRWLFLASLALPSLCISQAAIAGKLTGWTRAMRPNDARWRGVKAVVAKRVYLSPHLPFGWFDFPPGANRLLGAWWAGKLLYPLEFADVDLRAKVSEFHRRFYHREPAAAQLDAMLGEPGVLPR